MLCIARTTKDVLKEQPFDMTTQIALTIGGTGHEEPIWPSICFSLGYIGHGVKLSSSRGEAFVARKITRAVARIEVDLKSTLNLGNLEGKQDSCRARDRVHDFDVILQADQPNDSGLAIGQMHSVRELVELAFAKVGRRIEWRGASVVEAGLGAVTDKMIFWSDPSFCRPTEVDPPVGDGSKARDKQSWKPKRSSVCLIEEMMPSELSEAKRDAAHGNRSV